MGCHKAVTSNTVTCAVQHRAAICQRMKWQRVCVMQCCVTTWWQHAHVLGVWEEDIAYICRGGFPSRVSFEMQIQSANKGGLDVCSDAAKNKNKNLCSATLNKGFIRCHFSSVSNWLLTYLIAFMFLFTSIKDMQWPSIIEHLNVHERFRKTEDREHLSQAFNSFNCTYHPHVHNN